MKEGKKKNKKTIELVAVAHLPHTLDGMGMAQAWHSMGGLV